jgi:predicted transposase/invertase (TIGR01784 family)
MKKPLLSAKSDLVFKLIFGNPKRTDILADFLKSILTVPESEYDRIEVIDPFSRIEDISDKICIFDLKIHTKSRITIDVEIQIAPDIDMIKRILFYHAKMITEQLSSGEDYYLIQKTISIIILEHNILDEDSYCNSFRLRDSTGNAELTDLMEINILELPKLPKDSDNTEKWKWLSFIKGESEEELMTLAKSNPKINKAVGILKELSEDERLRLIEEAREKARRDERSRIHGATERGLQQGLQQGIAQGLQQGLAQGLQQGLAQGLQQGAQQGLAQGLQQGLQQGIAQGRLEMAENLVKLNLPIEDISKVTGLTKEEIEKIK